MKMKNNNRSIRQHPIIEVMPISYILLDKSGNILKTNQFLRNLIGYSKKELVNKNFQEIITEENFIFSEFVEKNKGNKNIKGIELRIQCKKGKLLYILFNANFLRNTIHCVFLDVSEKIMLYEKLGEAMELVGRKITICSNCKQIKTGQEEWDLVENFFWKKIKTRFSHGLCPECVKKLYPELK